MTHVSWLGATGAGQHGLQAQTTCGRGTSLALVCKLCCVPACLAKVEGNNSGISLTPCLTHILLLQMHSGPMSCCYVRCSPCPPSRRCSY